NQQILVLREAANIINLKVRSLYVQLNGDEHLLDLIEGLRLAYNALNRLSGIANAFNNLEKRQATAKVTARQIVDEVQILLAYRLAGVGVELETDFPDDGVPLMTDAAMVEHVFLNLLGNAIDAIREMGPEDRTKSPGPRRIRISATMTD